MFDKWKEMAEKSLKPIKNRFIVDKPTKDFMENINKKLSKSSEELQKMKDHYS
jgi:hypothetical protein